MKGTIGQRYTLISAVTWMEKSLTIESYRLYKKDIYREWYLVHHTERGENGGKQIHTRSRYKCGLDQMVLRKTISLPFICEVIYT